MQDNADIRLTPTSYIVLGLLEGLGEATPYDLKQAVAVSVGNLWSLQHAQLYAEPERLAAAGLLIEQREQTGRRRKRYTLTDRGREALRAWLDEPTGELAELRDPGLLKLFFGADPGAMAVAQRDAHERKLAEYRELHSSVGELLPAGERLALEAGIGHESEWLRFWAALAAEHGR